MEMDFDVDDAKSKAMRILPALVVVVVLALGVLYYVGAPKPGKVSVTVEELDSGKPLPSIELALSDAQGNLVGESQITDANGQADFANVPSATQLTLATVDVLPGYGGARVGVNLQSGGSDNAVLKLGRDLGLELYFTEGTRARLATVTEHCTLPLGLVVTNRGENEQEAQLVVESNTDSVQVAVGEPIIVPAKTAVEVNATLSAGAGREGEEAAEQSFALRLRKTQTKVESNFYLKPRPVLQASPSEISAGEEQTMTFRLRNDGKTPVTGLSRRVQVTDVETAAGCGQDASACIFIDWPKDASGVETTAIPASQELVMPMKITPPPQEGKYIGTLFISADCVASPGVAVPFVLQVAGPA
ncbi:MAG: hypothetical protein AABW54_01720 [Candidatus Micrarchaeota archaeon]